MSLSCKIFYFKITKVLEMSNIFLCNSCHGDASIVAHFDFVLPAAPSHKPNDNVSFYGNLKMCLNLETECPSEVTEVILRNKELIFIQ